MILPIVSSESGGFLPPSFHPFHKFTAMVSRIFEALLSIPRALYRRMTQRTIKPEQAIKTQEVVSKVLNLEPKQEPKPIPQIEKVAKKALPSGYLTAMLGEERLKYWCPKIGLVAGLVIGFYGANLVSNYAIFYARSQETQSDAYIDGARKLALFAGQCVGCESPPVLQSSPNELAEIDALLTLATKVNRESFRVVEEAAQSLSKASVSAAEASTLSLGGAKALYSFTVEATSGDVPINFFNPYNYLSALTGAACGYKLGDKFANWLNS
jgi:hypothetical protein